MITKGRINNSSLFLQDETLVERLVGLTEMFPESVRNVTYSTAVGVQKCVKGYYRPKKIFKQQDSLSVITLIDFFFFLGFYSISCKATWLFFSSSAILFAPLIFEIERAQMEEAQRNQQKQVLLGPSSAMSGPSGPAGFPMAPPIQR